MGLVATTIHTPILTLFLWVYGFELLDRLPFYVDIRLFQKKSYEVEDGDPTHDVYELYRFKLVDCQDYKKNLKQSVLN